MSVTQITVQSPSNETIYSNTAIGNTASAVKASSTLALYAVVDNTANVAATYVKFYNVASGSVTVGTTSPDEVLFCPASVISTFQLQTGATAGQTFGTALTVAAVTTGGTAGAVSPSSNVPLLIAYV